MNQSAFLNPFLGTGVGLRPIHYQYILENLPQIDWLEVISENYMGIDTGSGGKGLQILDKIRQRYPMVLHGVSLSIGSTDPLNVKYLKRLKGLIERISPVWISDHLCWSSVNHESLHDLLPLPFTRECLDHLVPRIKMVQDYLGQRVFLENISSYISFKYSEMTEWEFLSELCQRADCGLLLDINNVFVSAMNHHFDPLLYLNSIPQDRVGQIHLGGHIQQDSLHIDTHDQFVCESVWDLYRFALQRFGHISTLIEWDSQIPEFSVLEEEVNRARKIQNQVFFEETQNDASFFAHS